MKWLRYAGGMEKYFSFIWDVIKESAKGTVDGALNWGPIIGVGLLGGWFRSEGEHMPDILTGNQWTAIIYSALTFSAVAWAFLFLARFIFVVPYSMWKKEHDSVTQFEHAKKPFIHCEWRTSKNGVAEIILRNVSSRSITGVVLSFRNYRKGDDSEITDVIHPVNAVGESTSRAQLDPNIQMFYRFAKPGKTQIIFTPTGRGEIPFNGDEAGVKFTVSGDDLPGSTIFLRVKLLEGKVAILGPFIDKAIAVTPTAPGEL